MTDRQLEERIRHDVALSRLWILPGEIEIRVRHGIATLRGQVADRLAARVLERVTRQVAGIRAVVDELSWPEGRVA